VAPLRGVPRGGARRDELTGWNSIDDVDDLPHLLRAEISHFFAVYKDLDDGRHSEVGGWAGRDAARETVEHARRAYQDGS
jgi:inorganic pyrophosphatase